MTKTQFHETARKLMKEVSIPGTFIHQRRRIFWRAIGVPLSQAEFIGFDDETVVSLARRVRAVVEDGCLPIDPEIWGEDGPPRTLQHGECDDVPEPK